MIMSFNHVTGIGGGLAGKDIEPKSRYTRRSSVTSGIMAAVCFNSAFVYIYALKGRNDYYG